MRLGSITIEQKRKVVHPHPVIDEHVYKKDSLNRGSA